MHKFLLLLGLLSSATAYADIALTPDYTIEHPLSAEYVLSLAFYPEPIYTGSADRQILIFTKTTTWAFNAGDPVARHTPIFDPNFAGLRMYNQSLGIYDPASKFFLFSGGLFDTRIYTYSIQTMSIVKQGALADLIDLPNGMAVRNGTTDFFVSTQGHPTNPDYLPGLYRYTAVANAQFDPDVDVNLDFQIGEAFGNTGPGAVSNQVGAILFGPDGRLNVLDTGLQKILRYDPDTLAYLDAISLINTTTSNTSFTISSTGYIFTADTNGTFGYIYDYLSGDYIGTFTCEQEGRPPGSGGKLAMTADDIGNVYVVDLNFSSYISVFSTTNIVIPEPDVTALFIGGSVLVLAFFYRRKRKKAEQGIASAPARDMGELGHQQKT